MIMAHLNINEGKFSLLFNSHARRKIKNKQTIWNNRARKGKRRKVKKRGKNIDR